MRVLDYDGLKAKGVPYSKPHLWRLVKAGKFPAPIKWGAARNGWIEEEIDSPSTSEGKGQGKIGPFVT